MFIENLYNIHNTCYVNILELTGKKVRTSIYSLLYALGFFYNVLKAIGGFFKKRQVGYKVLVMQILFTGFEALIINVVMAIAIGAAVIIIGTGFLPQFGQTKLMYQILILIITRELGPLLTAFVVTARSGTAIATELGTMVVNNEIEAYIASGINPISYLAVPRLIGVTVSMLVLTIYFNIFGLLGSFTVVQLFKAIPIREYLSNLMQVLQLKDIFLGMLKALIFGMIIAVMSMFQGFSVNRASTEIPVAGIKAVGSCIVLIVIADVFVTVIQYVG